ncbi:MAG: DNA mismatch repair protein, partial [Candidatus Dormiibacterota bacterium]
TLPEIDPTATEVEARGLGHPLLDPRVRVDNDVRLGPSGQVLLVTGSNMSGKSTLLRSIGVNAVLAAAGGPVCAELLRLPPLRLWTSMRIDDSLAKGVSYFLAEVQRLKLVVDGVDAATGDPEGPLACYLLDEILQGTNTAERTVAARAVLRHLAGQRAIGAVSTHDLTLADDPSLQPVIRHVHLRETIATVDGQTTMTFDYRLRDGIATSTNALRLMSALGLPGESLEENREAGRRDDQE